MTVLIGPPDSGKSNTLEALGLASYLAYGGPLYSYFRAQSLSSISHKMVYGRASVGFSVDGRRVLTIDCSFQHRTVRIGVEAGGETAGIEMGETWTSYTGRVTGSHSVLARVRFYRFTWPGTGAPEPQHSILLEPLERERGETLAERVLLPPHGANLARVVSEDERVAELVRDVLNGMGFSDMVLLRLPDGSEQLTPSLGAVA